MSALIEVLKNYYAGRLVEVDSKESHPVYNPAFGKVIAHAPETPKEQVDEAIENAKKAQEEWAATPVTERIKRLFVLERLLREKADELARVITIEHGKTFEEAKGEVVRAYENVEASCAAVYHMMGKNNLEISRGIDEELYRVPVGVFAVISPFNFPLMVPFWFLPYAVALGNSVVVKPSEKTPLSMNFVTKLFDEAGFPPGVISVINGAAKTVDAILENKLVAGVSFVGSTPVAEYVYKKGCANHKRVQAGASAKNFEVVMPDADLSLAIPSLISSFFGNAGERCLAGSVLVTFPENHDEVLKRFTQAAKKLRLGYGLEPDVDMGPLIRREHLERVRSYVELGVSEGAKLVLDGRNAKVERYQNGFFMGPTIFDQVEPDMRIAKEEIFGPVASVITCKNLEHAIEVINSSRYGNASTIFTTSGSAARKFVKSVQAGNIGVNVGVAAPIAFYPFAGLKDSFFGDLHAQGGDDMIYFFTERKVVISRW
ncbi:methylmalonate-semialdehyde dehydrogenase (CoA acylating) [Candidatus Marsarchaeota G2 archaeon ECH_B_SAG-G06]|uniref:methylmalonate-semialdehyde dehydrogenase (CoA acylating) n=1 Tax=Candidatus Marsarchaeota G2 archaeon ECH_B_SAG-G06 TaxID=1978166 RepID=A0A2R6C1N2_9ARCH|nr:MAG: methylmalonate-semialdehyde dehydrogenase (CoA acylating) [Candidatus Marsarchaeota G2 archaeon ECH_B_SAG-G06]